MSGQAVQLCMRAVALLSAVAMLVAGGDLRAHAQAMMRSPNINIPSRIPSINPGAALRAPPPTGMAMRPALPNARYAPNLQASCSPADRSASGECLNRPAGADAEHGGSAKRSSDKMILDNGNSDKGKSAKVVQRREPNAVAAGDKRTIANELVAEIDGSLSTDQADALARRHGLQRISSQNVALIGATIGLFRIADRRSVETVSRALAAESSVRSVQPNYRYTLQQQSAPPVEGDPAQYALAKLRLPEAHRLAQGSNVTIAVIDSGVDLKHPEFADASFDAFDALGGDEGPHVHGTGIAGVIVSHARLMGSAPYARIIAIRAFGLGKKGGPESSSYVILKALDYAALHGAQIVNMSFAGPKDAVIERAIAAVAAKDVVMVAAAGNAGAKSPPLYPAANPNVIAVSATDARDQLLLASNRGNYIALAAPGADIFLPAPGGKYQMISGTSFSAAYVSGLAALVLERNPALKPETVRTVLTSTARDLGTAGRDDQFGAGQADAMAALQAVVSPQEGPAMSAAPVGAPRDKAQDPALARELRPASAAAMATEGAPAGTTLRPAQQ